MTALTSPLSLSVHHDSWIREQIRDLVLHLTAPVETAELLQVGLISLAQITLHAPVGEQAQPPQEEDFMAQVREHIKADLVDEVRQMTHLSRLQRRRWTLIKLAREHVQSRLRAQGQFRDPTLEELSAATGLSVTEIEVLGRMARLGPWEVQQGSHHLMELRSLQSTDPAQLRQAREDTEAVLQRVAGILLLCPRERLLWLQRHLGVRCLLRGEPVLPDPMRTRIGWLRSLMRRWSPRAFERRLGQGKADLSAVDEVWPRRLNTLLQPAPPPALGRPQQRLA